MLKTKISVLASIFIVAFALRLWFIFEYSAPLMADELSYELLATSILQGKGYVNEFGNPTAGRLPGYPLFLSIIYFFAGRNYFLIRLIQAVMGSLLCILIYYLGKKMFGEKSGILAGFLSSAHLGFIAQSAKILSEGLSTFFLMIAIIAFYQVKQNYRKPRYYMLAGLLIGITSLIHANLLMTFFLIALLLTYDLFKKISFKVAAKYLTIYSVAFLIPILPWTVRSYRLFHRFVPISTVQGIAFYTSYKPLRGKIYGFIPDDDVVKKANAIPSEAEQSNFLVKETFRLIRNDPAIFFRLLSLKMAYLFSPFDWELIRDKVVYNYLYVFYFPFFVAGSFIFLRRFNELSPLYLPALSIVLAASIFFGIPRFRVPQEPYMILLSSAAIIYIYQRAIYKRIFILFLSLFLLGNFLLYLNSSQIKQICEIFLKDRGM